MIALRLRFPAGRYHATPWGRHVNEAAIAWPPEPLRILRALIACHHRKADKAQFSDDALADLIDALAAQIPIYKLPRAVRGHTRHYMPAPVETTLVFDSFARFDADEPLIVGWPGAALTPEQWAHLGHLAARLGYLGRAESWVEAKACDEWNGDDANARPINDGGEGIGLSAGSTTELSLISLYAPLAPEAYRERRKHLIRNERESPRAGWTKKKQPKDKALDEDMSNFLALATLPERLAEALAVDTSKLHKAGWSDPPACKRVLYAAPEPASVWRGPRRHTTRARQDPPTVARFILAGRPRPRIEEAVKIGELMRLAALAQFGWTKDAATGRSQANAPRVISGRGSDNRPLRDADHCHAFWLPEDADGDGEIDHMVVYARTGFDCKVRERLDRITKLWIGRSRGSGQEEGADASGARQEWRLALEGFGMPQEFCSASRLLGTSKIWKSVTPFLAAGHLKLGGYPAEIRRLLTRRGLPEPTHIAFLRPPSSGMTDAGDDPYANDIGVCVRGRLRRAIHFHRFRSRGGEQQPDTVGTFLRLEFAEPIEGPLALGYACHFGLGLFAACTEDGR
jgi:CRISPR-associated protein Csb2